MGTTEASLNLTIALIVLIPAALLARWVLKRTPLRDLSGTAKWRALKIWIGGVSLIGLATGLTLYFLVRIILS